MAGEPVTVVGSYISPYVRKVLVCLDLKRVAYQVDPIVPFFGSMGIADIAVAAFFRNAAFAGFEVDPQRWPLTARFVARTLEHESFHKLRPFEDLSLKTPIAKHREALAEAGAPLSPSTLGTSTPRRGVLST